MTNPVRVKQITPEIVRKTAQLSGLTFSDAETAKFADQLDEILNYFEVLQQVNTNEIEPMVHPLGEPLPLRDDEVRRQENSALCPPPEGYRVPRVL